MPSHSRAECDDLFHYTGARWLWNEEEQLRQRYKWFNVEELKRVAALAAGAQNCISISKLAEGAYNKVLRLTMDNSSAVIARIPNPNAGPAFRTTASEVATMHFVGSILGLPVPKVLSWSANAMDEVASEYIIMEEASGTQLGRVWDDMELSNQLKIVDEIVAVESKPLSVSFNLYGNLYFAADAFPGCEKLEVLGDLPCKNEVESQFVIGPVVDRDFWSNERATMETSRGPWKTVQEYLAAIAQREIACICRYARSRSLQDNSTASDAQKSPTAHVALYEKFSSISPDLIAVQERLVRPALWHCDLHAPNIFVNQKHEITGIIDWQESWIAPLFLQIQHPRILQYHGPALLELPDHYKDLEEGAEKSQIRTQVAKSIALWTYETETQTINPDLQSIFQTPHGRDWRATVVFSADTWSKDIIPFRQCLIRVARDWKESHRDRECPISFSDTELEQHYRDSEGWNDRADFWDSLEGLIDRGGWTSHQSYEQALDMLSQLS